MMRDLDFLRDDLRAPIEYDASKRGYYLSDVQASLTAQVRVRVLISDTFHTFLQGLGLFDAMGIAIQDSQSLED